MTNYANPKMRMYGMIALAKKSRRLVLQQIKRLRNDTSRVTSVSGCSVLTLPLNYMIFQLFDSTELIKISNTKYL